MGKLVRAVLRGEGASDAFLSIHPYQDGNGRLSRLLTTLLLLRKGYDFMKYASMEIEIEKRR